MITLEYDKPFIPTEEDKICYHKLSVDSQYWCDNNDFFHRLDGPAIKWFHGIEEYYIHNVRHRLDGPAIIGRKQTAYMQNGVYHRLDGPAWIEDNYTSWFYKGERIFCRSQKEFERIIRLRCLW